MTARTALVAGGDGGDGSAVRAVLARDGFDVVLITAGPAKDPAGTAPRSVDRSMR